MTTELLCMASANIRDILKLSVRPVYAAETAFGYSQVTERPCVNVSFSSIPLTCADLQAKML